MEVVVKFKRRLSVSCREQPQRLVGRDVAETEHPPARNHNSRVAAGPNVNFCEANHTGDRKLPAQRTSKNWYQPLASSRNREVAVAYIRRQSCKVN